MMNGFRSQIDSGPVCRAVEVWRPQSMRVRAKRLEADGVAKPCLWKWTVRDKDDQPIGFLTLSTKVSGLEAATRRFGPRLTLFIRPAYQGLGYGFGIIEALLHWLKAKRIYKVLQASHREDDLASAERLLAANFLYTGCKTPACGSPQASAMQTHHMILIL